MPDAPASAAGPAPAVPRAVEADCDGLVGPTHNYAGLSRGNLASMAHRGQPSSPRQAALQGLAKMRRLADLGVVQVVLPPQERPDVAALRRLGCRGTDAECVERAGREDPGLLARVCSASAMWAANAATVAPACDTGDGRVHFVPANLVSHLHRSIEAEATARALARLFPRASRAEGGRFAHHQPLPACAQLADEGAANHLRLAPAHGDPGVHVWVYGRDGGDGDGDGDRASGGGSRRFPARQTREACAALARLCRLAPDRVLLIQQSPAAVDAGAFHDDVVAVANERLLIVHERAWVDQPRAIAALRARVPGLIVFEVAERELSLAEAVRTYLFNSQVVTLPDGAVRMLAPAECAESAAARAAIDRLLAGTPVGAVEHLDLRQSMANGGGPACLRLGVVLAPDDLAAVHRPCLLDAALHARLCAWVERRYRDRLAPEDLRDPALLRESREALDELTGILDLGSSFYPFQRP